MVTAAQRSSARSHHLRDQPRAPSRLPGPVTSARSRPSPSGWTQGSQHSAAQSRWWPQPSHILIASHMKTGRRPDRRPTCWPGHVCTRWLEHPGQRLCWALTRCLPALAPHGVKSHLVSPPFLPRPHEGAASRAPTFERDTLCHGAAQQEETEGRAAPSTFRPPVSPPVPGALGAPRASAHASCLGALIGQRQW